MLFLKLVLVLPKDVLDVLLCEQLLFNNLPDFLVHPWHIVLFDVDLDVVLEIAQAFEIIQRVRNEIGQRILG